MDGPVADEEPLARFLFSSSHYSRENNRVKFAAFMPAADGATSVFRVVDLDGPAIWPLGEEVARQSARNLHGRADFLASAVRKAGLEVNASEPPPRHANIERWPLGKSEQKLKAIQLADTSRPLLRD